MTNHRDVLSAVGNTPLIRLNRVSDETGCEIWGKAEFLNPGQSVKDRAALFIVRDAVDKGLLRAGGTIVEGTAGNTGIGLSLVANAMGFKTVIVIPETQSQEKKDALRLYGAELIQVPAKPYKNPNNYVKLSGRLAQKLDADLPNGAIWANQFDNVANRRAHVETTGPEIWDQTQGKLDGFIGAVGSGGTRGGVSIPLKAKNKDIQIGIADPDGAALYNYYAHGELKSAGNSITEGIGLNRVGHYETGGYTYFHKRVPLYWQNLDSWKVMAEAPAFNVMLYSASCASPRAKLPRNSPYRAVACFQDICVLRRPGGCREIPVARPPIGKMGVAAVTGYPYVAGVD